jgi:hypothetical protein
VEALLRDAIASRTPVKTRRQAADITPAVSPSPAIALWRSRQDSVAFFERIPFRWNRNSLYFSLSDRIFGRRTGVHPRIKSEGRLRLENALGCGLHPPGAPRRRLILCQNPKPIVVHWRGTPISFATELASLHWYPFGDDDLAAETACREVAHFDGFAPHSSSPALG